MMMRIFILAFSPSIVTSFVPQSAFKPHTACQQNNIQPLKMGFFDNLFGGGVQAEASHILISGDDADSKLEDIKQNIYKTALKGKSADMGVDAEALMSSFAQQARKFSSCPSGQKGGSLGCFGKGQMVPEFDEVVFNDQVGVVHGPIQTQFGSHLILITDRDE